jgi:hypothetical protein
MKRQWKKRSPNWIASLCMVGVLLLTESCFSTPFQNRKTTVFGRVRNEINEPIEGVPVVLYGQKGILGSQTRILIRGVTNVQGEYSLTTNIPKEFHSGDFDVRWFEDSTLSKLYKGVADLSINGQRTRDCCRVQVGQKTQYDWVLKRL